MNTSTTPESDLTDIIGELYSTPPSGRLYHYTSLPAFLSINENKCLWATEIRFLNDSQEMSHFADILIRIASEPSSDDKIELEIHRQLQEWAGYRIKRDGHMLFVISLSEEGNLLSQWRSYTTIGQGVSLGFSSNQIGHLASNQNFAFGKCIYDRDRANELAQKVISSLVSKAKADGPAPPSKKHPDQSYYDSFYSMEEHLLKISCLIKNPAFREEREWRLISRAMPNFKQPSIKLRPGRFSLIPYMEFKLEPYRNRGPIDHVYVGPSPNVNLSMFGVSIALSQSDLSMRGSGVTNSMIPYRNV